jgi:MFS family permease
MGDKRAQRRVLVAALVGIFVTSFPSVILVAALPEIGADFGVGESSVGWVLTAPMIAAAVLVPLLGRMGDLRGHRQVFLFGFGVAGLLAALSAASPNLSSLILLRTVSQATGMATVPTALAMIMATHGPAERPRALGAWAFAGASAPVIGLLAGGPLIDAVGWRGIFVLEAAIAAVALPLCVRALPRTPRRINVSFDMLGGALLMLGSGAAIFALDRSAAWGVDDHSVITAALLCPVALWMFARVERRAREPLFPLSLVRHRSFVAPVLGDSLLQVPSIGAFFMAPLILHSTFERSVGEAAYLLIPMPLGMTVLANVGGWLTTRFGERRTAVVGATLMLASLGVCAWGCADGCLSLLVLGFAMHGSAIGINQPALASAAARSLDAEFAGVGMAVMRMVSQLGSAAGISTAVAAVGAGGFPFAYGVLAVVGVAALAAASRVPDRTEPEPMQLALGRTEAVPAFE